MFDASNQLASPASARALLLRLLDTGLRAVEGAGAVRRALGSRPLEGPCWMCAVGKAAESMALGAAETLGEALRGGLVVTKPGHATPNRLAKHRLRVVFGGHPVPSAGSLEAGRLMIESIDQAPEGATLLFLLSGGASSLIEVPIAGIGLGELQRVSHWLLGSGLPIDRVNLIRKTISRIKGGGLLRWTSGHPVRALAISDVPGNVAGVIGSGLLTPEPELASRVAVLDLPDWLRDLVAVGLKDRETLPQAGPEIELVATLAQAQTAVAEAAAALGLPVRVSAPCLEGDATAAGKRLASDLANGDTGLSIWGGETTMRLPESPGCGGRNQHLALAAATQLQGKEHCYLLAAGTDGTDGPTLDAGGLVDACTIERGSIAGLSALDCLRRADSGRFLEASGDLVHTGPTGTNVMDLILGLKL